MRKDVLRLGIIGAVLIAALLVATGAYLRGEKEKQAQKAAQQPAPDVALFERPHSHSLGPKDAPVTIVEFLDPECEACRAMYPLVKNVLTDYGGRVRLVIRYVPFHANSVLAASALEAAAQQGRYWQMLEALFLNQPQWGDHHAPRPELIPTYAQQIGLDMEAFNKALKDPAHRTLVETDRADAQRLGVTGTPTFFVNGRRLERLGYEPLKELVEQELKKKS